MSRFILLLSAILAVLAILVHQVKAAAVTFENDEVANIPSEEVLESEDFHEAALPDSDIKNILKLHNDYRAKHHAPPLKWNSTLATFAQDWSNGCVFAHSGNKLYGENLGLGYNTWDDLIGAWYNEVKDYNYLTPGFSGSTGHFTQVVWKSTTDIGCGVQTCNKFAKGVKLHTCSYGPFGNVVGVNWRTGKLFFEENVLRP